MSVLKYFKNIPRSPSHRATGPMCNFFFKFATKSLERKKGGPLSPGGATGPPAALVGRAHWSPEGGGDRPPLSPVGAATGPPFFSPGTSLQIWREKITLWACRPMGGRPGYIFKIFQNGHIFLKF